MLTYDPILEMNKLVKVCQVNLKNSKKCLEYLENRNISKDSISKYKIGFFPQNVNILKEHISYDFLQKHSIVNFKDYSSFINHHFLIFPIFSEYDSAIAIMGRTLLNDEQRDSLKISKYHNSGYTKSRNLYGLNLARGEILKKQNVYVVEGNIDVIAMDAVGIHNVVGICGSAFSRYHLISLAKYTDKITFILDQDSAGQLSMERINQKFNNKGIKLRFCHLPPHIKDVDEYFNKYLGTKESFEKDLKPFIPNF